MQRVEIELKRLVSECNYEEVTRLFNKLSGGKRLRAKLILKIASNHDKAPLLAAIVELIHAASLLHDDVIDESDTRRGKPSINALFDNKTSIMFGELFAQTNTLIIKKLVVYHLDINQVLFLRKRLLKENINGHF